MACISSNDVIAKKIIRKTSRLASYYNSQWCVLYVQTSSENPDKIPLAAQRHLINNFKLATELGAEVIQVKSQEIVLTIGQVAEERKISTLCIGRPHFKIWRVLLKGSLFSQLLKKLAELNIDMVILS
jgi:two-component system sensor histidine kinase KdpD